MWFASFARSPCGCVPSLLQLFSFKTGPFFKRFRPVIKQSRVKYLSAHSPSSTHVHRKAISSNRDLFFFLYCPQGFPLTPSSSVIQSWLTKSRPYRSQPLLILQHMASAPVIHIPNTFQDTPRIFPSHLPALPLYVLPYTASLYYRQEHKARQPAQKTP